MLRLSFLLFFLTPLLLAKTGEVAKPSASVDIDRPAYTADGQLRFPARYREWTFLTSGVDMSYDPKPEAANHTMFNNVFVNPSAYRAFLDTGTWPEGTMLVLENRAGEGNHSINTRGRTQAVEVMGLEVHVKDSTGGGKNLPGGWVFYSFDNQVGAKAIARPASCYTCHEQHAAVDTTFVQFYPTLLGVAETKRTLSAPYLKGAASTVQPK